MVVAAQAGDEAGVAMLIRQLEPYRLVRLFMVLAAEADRDAVLCAAGFAARSNLRELHRQAKALRREGLKAADMPPHVVAGERMYRRLSRRGVKERGSGRRAVA